MGHLLLDLKRKGTEGFFYKELEDGVRHYKTDKEGREKMSSIVEEYGKKIAKQSKQEGRREGRKEGRKEGEAERRQLMARIKQLEKQLEKANLAVPG